MDIKWRIIELHICGDSQLIINQVNDDCLTKNEKLVPYKQMVDSLRLYYTFFSLQQIPRVENKVANAMAALASLLQLEKHELNLNSQWKIYITLFLFPKKVMLFVPLLVVSHPITVSFIHTFVMELYLTPLIDLNVETLFKMPLVIPLSLEICIGGVQMDHLLDSQKRKNPIKCQLTSMRDFLEDIPMVFAWLDSCLGWDTIGP